MGSFTPSMTDAGVEQLMVPVRDLATLQAASPNLTHMRDLPGVGAYCFTAVKAGVIRARGFFPELEIPEDPATGSAAAGLGLYLADRVGSIDAEIIQGVEMGRESHIHMSADGDRVRIGGSCTLVLEGDLSALPG